MTYDTLPCPQNLSLWFGKEECCSLCKTPGVSLHHILSGCKTALSQGRYRCRHDQVLRRLAEILERQRQEVSRGHFAPADHYIQFVQEGGGGTSATPRVPQRLARLIQDCSMRVDLGKKLQFSTYIMSTSLRPDIMMWPSSSKAVLLIELTNPWEAGVEAAW